ncbi:ATP-dependent DNA helicase Q5-like isoform X2 [Cotesia typhae]|uniref:ATP-dependent DNA helicase Q5-like isoform X2 n=1 Tax=Cotesia typhae TaxID=2053667 RepID=UPI003D682C8C
MDYDINKKIKKCLRHRFKFKYFKSAKQFEAIQTVLKEKNSDVLINLPPTTGKSLCFQLSAVLYEDNNVAIVFMSNNNALEEQVEFLKERNIGVCYFHSKLSKLEKKNFFNILSTRQEAPTFIYITTTAFASQVYKESFFTLIKNLYDNNLISMLVVDDAHSSSENTIDYNKSYNEIIEIRNNFPNVRLIALTSIGTAIINEDIKKSLGMLNAVEYNGDYNWVRSNIYIDIKYKDILNNPLDDVAELINNYIEAMESFSGIIICQTNKDTVMIADELSRRGIPTVPYFTNQTKSKEKWKKREAVMIAASHGSAIGLNKDNVGLVIHWSLPSTIDQYYIDIGKAGRLHGKAHCRIYFGLEDWLHAQFLMMSMSKQIFSGFEHVVNFCISDKCRHVLYSEIFGFTCESCKNRCDACGNQNDYREAFNKFQIAMQQHQLFNVIKDEPVTKIYIYKLGQTLSERLSNFQERTSDYRESNYRILALTLIKNYNRAPETADKPRESVLGIHKKVLSRLARSLEYIAFFTNNIDEYFQKLQVLRRSIKKKTASNTLSNYIINYKYWGEKCQNK